ncbi:MAG TPA: DUF1573 domain-containing protein, partial [Planctomycetota bacterium]|nr:DUF1573 domain-containing protein [Planctomycetota bacterium]
ALTVTPSPIDFGEVPWLETRAVKVVLRNDSAHEVFLRKLSYDCSCFSASQPVDATSLAPGREARLEVRLVTDSRVPPGRFRKTFTVETSDPVAPRIEVPMIGNITDFRSVTPREVTLGAVEAGGAPVTRTIEVRGGEGSTVAVVEAVTSDPRLETEIRPATDGTDVLVRTRKDAAKGRVSAQVRMTLEVSRSDGRMKRYPDSVWVNGEVR